MHSLAYLFMGGYVVWLIYVYGWMSIQLDSLDWTPIRRMPWYWEVKA